MTAAADLPLRYATPTHWADAALADPLALLNDHAHLEKKAAANALELLNRWPEPSPPEAWVAAMTAIARDEAEHLGVVTRILARRGGRLTRTHANPYANALRALGRRGAGPDELVDRLLISALIEARSCERFALLADACAPADAKPSAAHADAEPAAGEASGTRADRELAKLYRGLWASEHGHYLTFVQLAAEVRPRSQVDKRWADLLDAEARIIRSQPPGPRMHSGVV